MTMKMTLTVHCDECDEEGYRLPVSPKEAVLNAEIAHEVWEDRWADRKESENN